MLLYNLGYDINFIEGSVNNIKIVRQEDVAIATALLRRVIDFILPAYCYFQSMLTIFASAYYIHFFINGFFSTMYLNGLIISNVVAKQRTKYTITFLSLIPIRSKIIIGIL